MCVLQCRSVKMAPKGGENMHRWGVVVQFRALFLTKNLRKS